MSNYPFTRPNNNFINTFSIENGGWSRFKSVSKPDTIHLITFSSRFSDPDRIRWPSKAERVTDADWQPVAHVPDSGRERAQCAWAMSTRLRPVCLSLLCAVTCADGAWHGPTAGVVFVCNNQSQHWARISAMVTSAWLAGLDWDFNH